MKRHAWNQEKNAWLKEHRKISFEEVVDLLEQKKVTFEVIHHPNQVKHPGQKMYIINIRNYCYIVPFVEDSEKVFLKTIYQSRKATKQFLRRKENL